MTYRLDDDINTAAHFDREKLTDILEYVTRRAKEEGWNWAKFQSETEAYF